MSKYISLLFLPLAFLFCAPEYTLIDALNNYPGTLTIYTYQYKELPNADIIKNGNSYMISCDLSFGKQVYNNLNKESITGLSATIFNNEKTLDNLLNLLNINTIFSESTQNITFLYGYSPNFSHFVTYNGEKINVQIAKKENELQIGVPLILGGI